MENQLITEFDSQLQTLENEGKTIYHSNKFLGDIAQFMEHPETRRFYDEYLSNKNELEQALMFMHVYSEISHKFESYELNGLQKLGLLSRIMHNGELRAEICQQMTQWLRETRKLEN
jgi:hypothetical protein